VSKIPVIAEKSLFYRVLRAYVRFWHNVIFYRKVEVKNFPTNIPAGTPLLFVANHQNTLMDALAIVLNVGAYQPVFLTRADVFKRSFVRNLLVKLRMLPVYRPHDGRDEMQQNDEVFSQCIQILASGNELAAFPEGNHGVQYHLRPFKKGLARIVCQAETEHNWQLGIQIVPVGLYYTHCRKMGERLVLNFGTPIQVQAFQQTYQENAPRALTQLTRQMSESIKSLMLHFEDIQQHDTLKWLTDWKIRQRGDMLTNVLNRATDLEKLRQTAPEQYAQYLQQAAYTKQQMDARGIEAEVAGMPESSWMELIIKGLLLILVSPVALYGWFNSLLPFSLPWFVTRRLKDPQFSNAIRIVLYALVTFPLIWAVQILLVRTFFDAQTALFYAFSLPLTAYFAHRWARWWMEWQMQILSRNLPNLNLFA
jgi:1-acyl-sn-glycerol-3-phosphate acyltransferase